MGLNSILSRLINCGDVYLSITLIKYLGLVGFVCARRTYFVGLNYVQRKLNQEESK